MVVSVMVFFSGLASICSAVICDFVLDSFEDGQAMALLITSEGVKSDDKKLEKNLNRATEAMKTCRDLGYALGVGSLGVGLAAGLRIRKNSLLEQ